MAHLRLLVATEYFWPDEASTGRFLGELVGRLKEEHLEWDIGVLTSHRLYRSSRPVSLPTEEIWKGIRIHRIRSLRSGKDALWRRALSDLVFTLRVWARTLHTPASVVLTVSNPPMMPLLLTLLPGRRGVPVVYLIHDLYPDVPVALGLWRPRSVFVRVLRAAQKAALNRAACVVVLGESMKEHLVQAYRVRPEKITAIPNWATVHALGSSDRSPADGSFRVVYSGNIGRLHDFATVLDAAERLRDHPAISFRIVGEGPKARWLRDEIRRRRLRNVTIDGFLPDAEFVQLLQGASLGIITFEPGMEPLGVPSKTYNFLACGVPLIAISGPQSEVARIITDHRVGYLVSHGDGAGFAGAVLRAYQSPDEWRAMSDRARRYAQQVAHLDRAAREYADAILHAIAKAK